MTSIVRFRRQVLTWFLWACFQYQFNFQSLCHSILICLTLYLSSSNQSRTWAAVCYFHVCIAQGQVQEFITNFMVCFAKFLPLHDLSTFQFPGTCLFLSLTRIPSFTLSTSSHTSAAVPALGSCSERTEGQKSNGGFVNWRVRFPSLSIWAARYCYSPCCHDHKTAWDHGMREQRK